MREWDVGKREQMPVDDDAKGGRDRREGSPEGAGDGKPRDAETKRRSSVSPGKIGQGDYSG